MSIVRKYTIPPGDEDDYDHHYTIYWPFFGGVFLMFMFFGKPEWKWLIAVPFIFGLYYFFKTKRNEKNHREDDIPSYFIFLVLLNIVCGVLWTKLCSGLLVDLLTVIGLLTNLSTTYLGLTILAIGNALPDGLTTISIASKG